MRFSCAIILCNNEKLDTVHDNHKLSIPNKENCPNTPHRTHTPSSLLCCFQPFFTSNGVRARTHVEIAPERAPSAPYEKRMKSKPRPTGVFDKWLSVDTAKKETARMRERQQRALLTILQKIWTTGCGRKREREREGSQPFFPRRQHAARTLTKQRKKEIHQRE